MRRLLVIALGVLLCLTACEAGPVPSATDAMSDAPAGTVLPPETEAPEASPADLRTRFPQYYGLSTFKGLELYVRRADDGTTACGLMEGTNRNKTEEEIAALPPATVPEMREILASYEIEPDYVFIAFDGDPYGSPQYEEARSVLRAMLFPDASPEVATVYARLEDPQYLWTLGCLNAWSLPISSVLHLPVHMFSTHASWIEAVDASVDESSPLREAAAAYTDEFFADHVLLLVTAPSGAVNENGVPYRWGFDSLVCENGRFCLFARQSVSPEPADVEAACFLLVPLSRATAETITAYDAQATW